MARRAVGSRGSWFAKVGGERLPCDHKYWWPSGDQYNDTGLKPNAQADELVAAIRSLKKVILTSDTPVRATDGTLAFERTGYIAIYAVEDIEYDGSGLRLRFVSRLEGLE